MPLTGRDVEQAFVATAHEQVNGEAFNWDRVAQRLNFRLRSAAPGRPREWTFAR